MTAISAGRRNTRVKTFRDCIPLQPNLLAPSAIRAFVIHDECMRVMENKEHIFLSYYIGFLSLSRVHLLLDLF